MKVRVELGLAFFLLLFLISIGDPLVYKGGILRRIPSLEMSAGVQCLTQSLPADARALFFSNSDGTLDWNAYNFMATRTQYELAPRVIAVVTSGRAVMDDYPYLLAYQLDAAALAQISSRYQRQVLQTCGNTTVLGRLP